MIVERTCMPMLRFLGTTFPCLMDSYGCIYDVTTDETVKPSGISENIRITNFHPTSMRKLLFEHVGERTQDSEFVALLNRNFVYKLLLPKKYIVARLQYAVAQ